MSSKLIPSNPAEVMVIRHVTPNVVTFSVPFLRFGMLKVGGRGTLIRLSSGKLAIVSPVALTGDVKTKVAELGGRVAYLLAPDMEHHIFITEWAREYPDAKIIGPDGLPEKRAKTKGDDKIGKEHFAFVYNSANAHDNSVDADFAADFDVEFVEAHPNKEIVLLYKPDRVLIQADLFFNLPCKEQYQKVPPAAAKEGFLSRIFTYFNRSDGDAKAIRRVLWYGMSAQNRPAWNRSVRRIHSWDFDTIIPCHGETVVGNGKALFEKVFAWHLQARD